MFCNAAHTTNSFKSSKIQKHEYETKRLKSFFFGGKSKTIYIIMAIVLFAWRRHRFIAKKSLMIPKGGNQNTYIEKVQKPQWPNEKVQKDKQRSTKHTYKTKHRATQTPLKTWGELRCSGRVGSSCSTSGTHRVKM